MFRVDKSIEVSQFLIACVQLCGKEEAVMMIEGNET
jgi:hypothetical protein